MSIADIQDRMNNNPHLLGLALVISNDYDKNASYPILRGTEKDGDAMAESLGKLKFLVVRKHNATLAFMSALLQKAGEDIVFPRPYKKIVFVFAGHGEEGGELITSEGGRINVHYIVERLSPSKQNQATTQLGDMARMFFIDACRGKRDDLGFNVISRGAISTSDRGGRPVEKIRISERPTNIIVAYPTVAGYKSYEIEGKGGIWLQCLARKLVECNCSIGDVLVKVNKELVEFWQDSGIEHIMNPESINRLCDTINLFEEASLVDNGPTKCPAESSTQPPNVPPTPAVVLVPNDKLPLSSTCSSSSIKKIQLAASFMNHTPGQPPSLKCEQSNSTQSSSIHSSGACAMPKKEIPQETHAVPLQIKPSSDSTVLSREAGVPNQGRYRDQLNRLKTKGVIITYKFSTQPHHDLDQSFRSTVVCKQSNGQEIIGDSIHYYKGKKAVAEEKAAKNVLSKLSISSDYSMTPPYSHDTATVCKTGPSPNKAGSNTSKTGSSPEATNKLYKQILHNFLVQQLRKELPIYDTIQNGTGSFQCTVSHSLTGRCTGNKFATKKEAENSAAWRAYLKLKELDLL